LAVSLSLATFSLNLVNFIWRFLQLEISLSLVIVLLNLEEFLIYLEVSIKFPLITPYYYKGWHQNAWNVLMQQVYTPYVEQQVTKPTYDKEKVL
jgi:hypothetical protein